MPDPAKAEYVPVGQLVMSRSPAAEISTAALRAQGATGLERCDFIIVACPPGSVGPTAIADVERAARRAPSQA